VTPINTLATCGYSSPCGRWFFPRHTTTPRHSGVMLSVAPGMAAYPVRCTVAARVDPPT